MSTHWAERIGPCTATTPLCVSFTSHAPQATNAHPPPSLSRVAPLHTTPNEPYEASTATKLRHTVLVPRGHLTSYKFEHNASLYVWKPRPGVRCAAPIAFPGGSLRVVCVVCVCGGRRETPREGYSYLFAAAHTQPTNPSRKSSSFRTNHSTYSAARWTTWNLTRGQPLLPSILGRTRA